MNIKNIQKIILAKINLTVLWFSKNNKFKSFFKKTKRTRTIPNKQNFFVKIISRIKKTRPKPLKKNLVVRSFNKSKGNQLNINKKRKYLKISLAFLALIIFISLIFLAWQDKKYTFLTGNKSNSVKNNALPTTSLSPGKVIDISNLNEELPQKPEVIAQGRFNNVEQIVSGKALFIQSDKEKILRFEDFETVNGQDIHIYLSPVSNLEKNDAIDLGLLKTTSGNFNYSLDNSVDIKKYNNVLIWSDTFNAFFGYANLSSKELPEIVPTATPEKPKELKSEEKEIIP